MPLLYFKDPEKKLNIEREFYKFFKSLKGLVEEIRHGNIDLTSYINDELEIDDIPYIALGVYSSNQGYVDLHLKGSLTVSIGLNDTTSPYFVDQLVYSLPSTYKEICEASSTGSYYIKRDKFEGKIPEKLDGKFYFHIESFEFQPFSFLRGLYLGLDFLRNEMILKIDEVDLALPFLKGVCKDEYYPLLHYRNLLTELINVINIFLRDVKFHYTRFFKEEMELYGVNQIFYSCEEMWAQQITLKR